MKIEPMTEAIPHATAFDAEMHSGNVRRVAKGARHGWRLRFGGEMHEVLLPKPGLRSGLRLTVDGRDVAVPRFGLRKNVALDIDGHPATVEMWTAFEPVRRWARKNAVGRAGVLGVVAGLLSAATAGGVFAAAATPRRSRAVASLTVDGIPGGAWLRTFDTETEVWEFAGPDVDVAELAADWDSRGT